MNTDTLERMFPFARYVRVAPRTTAFSTTITLTLDDRTLCQFRDPYELYNALSPHPVRQFAVGRHPLRLVRGRR